MHFLGNNADRLAIAVSGAVEGDVDESVLRRLIEVTGYSSGTIYGRKGKDFLRTKIDGYNAAAHFSCWTVLVDLDREFPCAAALRNNWLAHPAPLMCFRIVVHSIEAWLMSDSERFLDFFSIARRHSPANPESIPDPKEALIDTIRHSRRRDIREDMLPRPESGRRVGPAYSSHIMEFVGDRQRGWRPEVAETKSISLRRCISCMRHLADRIGR